MPAKKRDENIRYIRVLILLTPSEYNEWHDAKREFGFHDMSKFIRHFVQKNVDKILTGNLIRLS